MSTGLEPTPGCGGRVTDIRGLRVFNEFVKEGMGLPPKMWVKGSVERVVGHEAVKAVGYVEMEGVEAEGRPKASSFIRAAAPASIGGRAVVGAPPVGPTNGVSEVWMGASVGILT